MRHGLLVEVAELTSCEAAIVEMTLAYRAGKYGKSEGDRVTITVSLDQLESEYEYFDEHVDERLKELSGTWGAGNDPAYLIKIIDYGGMRVAIVSVSKKWLEIRRSL